MIDPLALLDNVFSELGDERNSSFPDSTGSFPGAFPGSVETQVTADERFSRISRRSRLEYEGPAKTNRKVSRNTDARAAEVARTRSHVETSGNPGNPGNEVKTLARPDTWHFPTSSSLPGKREGNREIADTPPPGVPLPIAPADVHAGVARELRALSEDGREGPAALRDAVEITRAKIRNSEALAERQANGGRCHVCDGPLDDSAPVVAVLSWSRGAPLHLHAGCHDAYSARRIALVDRIIAAAGYGAEVVGEAA